MRSPMFTLLCLMAPLIIAACSVLFLTTGSGNATDFGPCGASISHPVASPEPVKPADSSLTTSPAPEEHDAAWENKQGVALEYGKGVTQNSAEALTWFKKAADSGNVDAMINLGMMNKLGHGTPQNYAAAMKWWRLAAQKGDPKAENAIGRLYEDGDGVRIDYAAAMKWYRRASDRKFGLAQFNIGIMHQNGFGTPYDDDAAMKWYQLAAKNGSEEGKAAVAYVNSLCIRGLMDDAEAGIVRPPRPSVSAETTTTRGDHPRIGGRRSVDRSEQPFYNSSSSYSGFSGTVCNDGSLSGAMNRRGACSHHGGIAN